MIVSFPSAPTCANANTHSDETPPPRPAPSPTLNLSVFTTFAITPRSIPMIVAFHFGDVTAVPSSCMILSTLAEPTPIDVV